MLIAPVENAEALDWEYLEWYVGNGKLAATYFVLTWGFKHVAYRGMETGSRYTTTHVVRNGNIVFAFTSHLHGKESLKENGAGQQDLESSSLVQDHIAAHGDSVKNIALKVTNVKGAWARAIEGGATSVQSPHVIEDSDGYVTVATIKAFGNVVHSFIDRSQYHGAFLPGFKATSESTPVGNLPSTHLLAIDHIVANQVWDGAEAACSFYETSLGFERFWSIDDTQACTEFSALRSTVMTSPSRNIKLSVIEPAPGKKKSSVVEFLDFNSGMAGCGHIAMITPSIVSSVEALRQRGVEFMKIPPAYYEQLRTRLASSKLKISEDMAALERLNILVDYDEDGYLLQIFTMPFSDRPTVFFEVIQRQNFEGFGAGNFKSLFEALERTQALRGNLV